MMARYVDIIVDIIVVPTIFVVETESYCIRIAITVVGIKVNPDVFKARNVTMDLEAVSDPLSCFICSIAFIPIGVAALPKPNIFAVIFERIYPIAGSTSGIAGKLFLKIGLNSFAIASKIPAFSCTLIKIGRAYV